MGLECGWRHGQKRWSWEFEDFEKTELRSTVEGSGWVFRIWSDHIFGSRSAEMDWNLKHHEMPRAWVGRWWSGQHSFVSIDFYDLCFSPRVAKDWSQKLINLIVPPVFVLLLSLMHIQTLWVYNILIYGRYKYIYKYMVYMYIYVCKYSIIYMCVLNRWVDWAL